MRTKRLFLIAPTTLLLSVWQPLRLNFPVTSLMLPAVAQTPDALPVQLASPIQLAQTTLGRKAALAQAQTLSDRKAQSDRLFQQGSQQFQQRQYEAAIQSLQQALTSYRAISDRIMEAAVLIKLGETYYGLKQYPQAIEVYQQALAISRTIPDRKAEVDLLIRIGSNYYRLQQYPQAIESYQQALTISRELKDFKEEVRALSRLAMVYGDLKQVPKVIDAYEQALVALRNMGNRKEEIRTLNTLAKLYRDLEQYTKMIEAYQQSLAVSRTVGDRKAEVDALLYLGDAYRKLNQHAKAIEFYEQAEQVLTAFRDKDASPEEALRQRQQKANLLKELGSAYQQLKQYSKAIQAYQQVLAIGREIGQESSNRQQDIAAIDLDNGGDLATLDTEVDALVNLSFLSHLAGQSQRESEFYQQALVVSRNIYGRKGEVYVMYRLAGMYDYNLRLYPKAIELYQQALTLIRSIGDPKNEIYTLLELGKKHLIFGPYQKAIESYQQATETYERTDGLRPGATTLTDLGVAYHYRGQYAKAIRLYEQVIHTSNKPDEVAPARVNLGVTFHALGQYQKAINSYQQALTFFQKDSYRRKFKVATTLDKLGMVYQSLGQHQAALKSYQQALAILQKDEDAHNETAIVLDHLGAAYQSLGQAQKAIKSHQQALAIFQEISNRGGEANVLNNLGEAHRSLGQYNRAITFYQQSLAIKQNLGDRPGEGLSFSNLGNLYNSKGQYADAELSLFQAVEIWETLRGSGLNDENKISLFDTQADTYRFLQQALIAQNKIDAALEAAERGRARAFVELLALQLSPQSNEPIKYPSLEQIKQIAKEQNATMVEYSIVPDQSLYIWVIGPNGKIDFRSVDLKTWQKEKNISIKDLVANTRESIGVRSRGMFSVVKPVDEQNQTQRLQQLHQLLIEPIANLLPADPERRVIFIPQGELFLAPFSALQDAAGKYLIEKHTILTAPAIQVLELTRQQQQRTRGAQALVVGNPTMPSVPPKDGEKPQPLPNLPGAKREAEAIAFLLNTKALTGNEATKAAILGRLPQAKIVHLATHGLFDDLRGLGSAIALAPTNTDNGLLTAEEILKLKLNASLVVLSACNTGSGRITGDGVIGLSRSLFLAGTPSVIVSLWAVPDAPTQELMTEFYTNLYQKKLDKAQALRMAMLKMMEKHRDNPRAWAAFTLIGEAK